MITDNKKFWSTTRPLFSSKGRGGGGQAIEKLKCHSTIISIKENIQIQQEFSFSGVNADEFTSEINNLNSRKAGTFIPPKQLKQAVDIITETLTHI